MPQIVVRQKTPKANIYLGIPTITLRNIVPIIIVYDDKYIEPAVPYVDAGLYNQEGVAVDAGLFSTNSWEITWDGGTPFS